MIYVPLLISYTFRFETFLIENIRKRERESSTPSFPSSSDQQETATKIYQNEHEYKHEENSTNHNNTTTNKPSVKKSQPIEPETPVAEPYFPPDPVVGGKYWSYSEGETDKKDSDRPTDRPIDRWTDRQTQT